MFCWRDEHLRDQYADNCVREKSRQKEYTHSGVNAISQRLPGELGRSLAIALCPLGSPKVVRMGRGMVADAGVDEPLMNDSMKYFCEAPAMQGVRKSNCCD